MTTALLVWLSASARAEWDPRSTAQAPCGTGEPPAGHFSPEFAATGAGELSLAARQDGSRLCYVADGIAEAPVIRVRQGDRLTITLRNEISDPSAIAGFLPETSLDRSNPPVPPRAGFLPVVPGMRHRVTGTTNLHVHGFAVPPVPPQDEVLRTCADPAVGPPRCGRREITYVYQVPATMPAGLYWYHPHIHGEADVQTLMGLSGAIVVEGAEDDVRRAAGIEDRVLIVRQTRDPPQEAAPAEADGAPPIDYHSPAAAPAISDGPAPLVDTEHEVPCAAPDPAGHLTLNGAMVDEGDSPDDRLANFAVPAGGQQLWRIVNAAAEAYLDLALIDGAGRPVSWMIVARDGAPLSDDSGRALPPVASREAQLVPPGGRLEVLVAAPANEAKAYLVSHAVDTGCAGDPAPERRLAMLTAAPARAASDEEPAAMPLPRADPGLFAGILAQRTERVRRIAFAEYPRPGVADATDFYITELEPGARMTPFAMTGSPTITVRSGAAEEWVIENWTRELHAFHIHQVHFRVLEIDRRKLDDPPLLDIVNVPYAKSPPGASNPGALVPGSVRIKLVFPAALAGDIPFHCHLMEHEDNGMMGVVRVLAPGIVEADQRAQADGAPDPASWPICRATDASVE